MTKKSNRTQMRPKTRLNKLRVTLVSLVLLLGFLGMGVILAHRDASQRARQHRARGGQITPEAFGAGSPAREYTYLGDRLLSSEEPTALGLCAVPPAAAPSPLPADVVWVEDQVPAGATQAGTWTWDTSQVATGTQSIPVGIVSGTHHLYFTGATQILYVGPNDTLVCYVLASTCALPQEVMLQWHEPLNGWEHRAFWGSDLIASGTSGTASRL